MSSSDRNTIIIRISTAEAVVNYFKAQLESGTMSPGDQLPSERILQKELGISRFSLREGLARLSALGIIRIVHGKGAFICSELNCASLGNVLVPLLSSCSSHFEELFEARRLIESELSRLAAVRRNEDDLARLHSILSKSDTALDDAELFGELDYQFHREVASLARNVFLEKMLEVLNDQVRSFLRAHAEDTESRRKARASHEKIFKCICDRDADAAAEKTRRHLSGCKSNFESSLLRKKGAVA